MDIAQYTIRQDANIKAALSQLNQEANYLTLFVINSTGCLVGTLTDGDIRRGLLADLPLSGKVEDFMHKNFKSLSSNSYTIAEIDQLKTKKIKLLPILDQVGRIKRIVDLSQKRSLLPLDAVIMAGGKGSRLHPLTLEIPKPLIKIGEKPIIEHNIDRLDLYGVHNLYISINYLGEQITGYFGNGENKGLDIHYIEENEPLGTAGALALVEQFDHDYLVISTFRCRYHGRGKRQSASPDHLRNPKTLDKNWRKTNY